MCSHYQAAKPRHVIRTVRRQRKLSRCCRMTAFSSLIAARSCNNAPPL